MRTVAASSGALHASMPPNSLHRETTPYRSFEREQPATRPTAISSFAQARVLQGRRTCVVGVDSLLSSDMTGIWHAPENPL